MEVTDLNDAYAVWRQYIGDDFTPADALQEANDREMTIDEITAELVPLSLFSGEINPVEYARVFEAVYVQIEDAFEQQAPSL